MAWNQPGKGGQNGWRGKPSGGGGMDSIPQKLRDWFGGPGGGIGPLGWIGAALALLLLFNSFKLVDEQQRGVVLRFGAFDRVMGPGANVKWPWPIETVTMVQANTIQSLEDSVRVLTRDENIVDIKFNVQYQVSDPRAFLYSFRDDLQVSGAPAQGRETLQNAAESAVREVVGNHSMDTVLFDRTKLLESAKKHLQDSLDMYDTGLLVTDLNLTDARPPTEVKESFDEANRAAQDKESRINTANAYASKILPEARGVASRIKAESQGYRDATIAKAEGDAQRFSRLVAQYRKAPEVTRKRLYLETMQHVLAQNRKVIAGRDNNILYLPVDGAPANAGAAAAAAPMLPAVKASTATPTDTRPERETRPDGREGGR
jgi:membrane protease subunit HflK